MVAPAIVPGAATGRAMGLLASSSVCEWKAALVRWVDPGREKLGGLAGGADDKLALAEAVGTQSTAVAVSDVEAWGEDGRKGPSSALRGDSGLLPGIVSSPDRVAGDEACRAARTS